MAGIQYNIKFTLLVLVILSLSNILRQSTEFSSSQDPVSIDSPSIKHSSLRASSDKSTDSNELQNKLEEQYVNNEDRSANSASASESESTNTNANENADTNENDNDNENSNTNENENENVTMNADANTDVDADADADADTYANTDATTNTNENENENISMNADADADTDANTDANTNADADTDATINTDAPTDATTIAPTIAPTDATTIADANATTNTNENENENSNTNANENQNQNQNQNAKTTMVDKSIREWGCDRSESPLIFVHRGKMGGGNVRARLAAAALNFNRSNWKQNWTGDDHYYPVRDDNNSDSEMHRGKFCNSHYPHYSVIGMNDPIYKSNQEGTEFCNATTPFGIAIACPHPHKKSFHIQDDIFGMSKKKKLRKLWTLDDGDHYESTGCPKCDDDYYLNEDYYFDKNGVSVHSVPGSVANPESDPHPRHTCHIVLATHTNIGSELNFLPPRYLKEHWWDNSIYGSDSNGDNAINNEFEKYWATLLDDRHHRRKQLLRKVSEANGDTTPENDLSTAEQEDTSTRWCPSGYYPRTNSSEGERVLKYDRPARHEDYAGAYETCGKPLAESADKIFLDRFFPSSSGSGDKLNYAPFYASMPVHRITMIRDPWSWILSKFFWHKLDKVYRRKVNGTGTVQNTTQNTTLPCMDLMLTPKYSHKDPMTGDNLGWIESYSIISLMQLCGNDCLIRYKNNLTTLEEIENQAESNLRNSFSVVGLLNETESFYDMITDRIAYVDMTLNPNVQGGQHKSKTTEHSAACKDLYQKNETFQEDIRSTIPAFAALERLYHVGIEVNRFQLQELKQCRLSKGETPTKGWYNITLK